MLHAGNDITANDHPRLASIGGAILVHLLLIAFILSGLPKIAPVPRSMHELMLVLIPKPKRIKPKPPDIIAVPRAVIAPPSRRTPYYAPPIAPTTAPLTKALNIPSLRCSPENFEKLSPEDRQSCGSMGIAPPDKNTIAAFRSHVREPERHAEELAARRTPASVDCTHVETQVIDNIAQDNGVFVDPVCVARKIRHALGR